jgi:hypothetical protein
VNAARTAATTAEAALEAADTERAQSERFADVVTSTSADSLRSALSKVGEFLRR